MPCTCNNRLKLFNRSLQEKQYPKPWKKNNVVPLFKKGDKADSSNYRPVSLSSPIGKVMELVVFKNLYNHLQSNNLLHKYQSGFVPGHSTTFQLIDIYHHIWQSCDIHNILVWFSVISQKRLIGYGIRVCYLN